MRTQERSNSLRPNSFNEMYTIGASSSSGDADTEIQVEDAATVQGNDDDEDTINEGVAPKVARQPGQPTAQERREHEVCHVPYRSWCRHCVRGRGRRRPHCRIGSGRDEDLPHAAIDYTFFTQNVAKKSEDLTEEEKVDDRKATTVLVMKDSLVESIFAYVVSKKGTANEEWLALQMLDDIDSLGFTRHEL